VALGSALAEALAAFAASSHVGVWGVGRRVGGEVCVWWWWW
jgi:hypothetical protein